MNSPPPVALKSVCFSWTLVAAVGCGNNNGGSTSETESTGTTTSNDSDDTEQPTENGNLSPIDDNDCGAVVGWETRCYQDGAFINFSSNSDENIAQTITNIVGSGNGSEYSPVCCEGLASEAEADAACADRCQRLACEAARSNHLDLAEGAIGGLNSCADWIEGSPNCGFDMNECLTATWHEQTIDAIFGDTSYFLRAACNNAHTNETFTNSVFDWRDLPFDFPDDNPFMCDDTPDVEWIPGFVVPDDSANEDAGMTAAVSWLFAGTNYTEDSQDAELQIAYDLHDCPNHARCLDLAKLQVKLPAITVQGISIQNAHLSVYQVDTQPVLQSSGRFSYGPGTLHAIMSASADGIPIMLQGSNTGTATGLLAPSAGSLTFSGLQFDYSDSVIAAQLQIDIVGQYTARGPTAVIVPAIVPLDCLDPVTFRAGSSDPDAQSLTHYWWVPGVLTATGSTLDVVLANGTHMIGLVSQDTDGRLDAGLIQYTRSCR